MTKLQTSLRNKCDSIIEVLLRFIAVYAGYLPMESAKDDLIGKVADIDDADEVQRKLIKAYRIDKLNKKKAQAVKAKAVARKISAFAYDTANTILFGEMKISLSKLIKSNSKAALSLAKNIYDAGLAMAPDDKLKYEVTDDVLSDLKKAMDAYELAISAPRDQIIIRKAATQLLPILFNDAEKIVNDRLTNLMANYQFSNPDFYEQYNSSLIEITFNRYTAIEGEIIDEETGEDLGAVKVLITSSDKNYQEVSNHHGNYAKRQLNPNIDYDLTFELPDYETVTTKVKDLTRGKHKILNIQMKKKTV